MSVEAPPPSSPRPDVSRWELYRVLSEPVRLRLLALTAEEELAVGELAELLGESQPNVSRHAASLKQAGLLAVRRHGTRALLRLQEEVAGDPVVSDALASGRALCRADGSLRRIADVLRARDSATREFFARPGASAPASLPRELSAYLVALGQLVPSRGLAVDAGTGDGGLLDVLSPVFEKVVAVDRSEPQIARARERVALRAYDNVSFVLGELDAPQVSAAAGEGADAVFAVRVLHHAAQPARAVESLARLCRPGGALVVLDYAAHDDEAMRDQADLWLGFEATELARFSRTAGLVDARVVPIPAPSAAPPPAGHDAAPDAHLPLQLLVARKPATGDVRTGTVSPLTRAANRRKAATHGK